jgi:magnesium-transporting ATPase (P-type)
MKILAATKQSYSRSVYIVELDASELSALNATHTYSKLEVTRVDGSKASVGQDDLLSGDVIEKSVAEKALADVLVLKASKEEIAKSAAVMRGAITKLLNTLPPAT